MSKNMKGFSIDPSTYGAFEDPKVRFKHRALMQDYRELQKETVAMRNKLDSTKLRKLTLWLKSGSYDDDTSTLCKTRP